MPRDGAAASRGQGPLYRRLLGRIHARIREGGWAAGTRLPSERALSEQFGVSRATVRQALEELSRGGVLERRQGRGTFVAHRNPITQGLERVTAFRDALAAQGVSPAMRLLSRTQGPCDYVLGRLLAIAPGSPVARLVVLGLGDGEPLVIYRSHLPAAGMQGTLDVFCASIASEAAAPMPSELYARRTGLAELRAEQTFEVRTATPEEARLLAVGPAAVFAVTSLVFGPDGTALEYREAVYRGDRYKFNIERVLRL